ncbi:MAG TPA: HD domain-containing protein [Blastocatellia bacterium]|nr:HD domain-containing protein [Blastocatellia bacterium]
MLYMRIMGNTWSPESYNKTYLFAARAHRGQLVPGTDLPYVVHVNMVSLELISALRAGRPDDHAYDEELAVQCALLHDVIEDTTVSEEEIRQEFGSRVADGVRALSKDATLAKPLQMPDSLRRLRQQPREVQMVKLADRITNLQPPPAYWTPEKIAAYRMEAIEIHDALKDAHEFLASRLRLKIEEYRRFLPDQTAAATELPGHES